MTHNAEHMNYSPGLADGYCGHCAHLLRRFAAPICSAFDSRLVRDGTAIKRCVACLNHGATDHNHHED